MSSLSGAVYHSSANLLGGRDERAEGEGGGKAGGGGGCFLIFLLAFASIGGLLFGYDIGIVSGVKTFEGFLNDFDIDWHYDNDTGNVVVDDGAPAWAVEWFVSSLLVGCAIGALGAAPIASQMGRKWAIFFGSLVFLLGNSLVCSSQSLYELYPARVVTGLAVGALSFIVPLYASEISPSAARGTLIAIQQMAIVSGIFIAFLVNIPFEHASNGWRWSIGIGNAFAIVLLIGSPFLPESPRWLLMNKGWDRALAVLERVRNPGAAVTELREIEAAIREMDQAGVVSWGTLLKDMLRFTSNPSRRVWLACGLQLFQQLTGMNAIMYYAPEIFQAIGTDNTLIPTAVTGAVNLVATAASLWLIGRHGRKPLLMTGAVIMLASLATLSILLATHAADGSVGGYAAIVAVCIFVVGFAISWGPLCWVYPAEIFPGPIRAKGIALSTAVNWTGNLAIGLSALQLLKAIEWGFYLILCFFLVIMFFYVRASFFLETAKLTLEEIDAMFAAREKVSLFPIASGGSKKSEYPTLRSAASEDFFAAEDCAKPLLREASSAIHYV